MPSKCLDAEPLRSIEEAEAVLLDAAGTLIRPREPVEQTYAAAARRFGVELDVALLPQTFKAVFEAMPDLAFTWTSLEELRRQERDWWRDLVRRVVDLAGSSPVRDFDGFFEALFQYYNRGGAWECFPDVLPALIALHNRGCRLNVVSNFDSRLPRILRELKIGDQMDAVVYSSAAGSAKPDPLIFEKALAALGITAKQAIHVGDNPRADVAGAAAAGVAGLLIRRDGCAASSSKSEIGSLEELFDRFDSSSC